MAWKGVILKNSLEEKSLLELVKVIEIKNDRYYIEVDDKNKEEFVQKACKSIKPKFYIHLVKDKVMYVMFINHMFKFSRGYPELETAREFGKSIGIPEEQMPFEKLLENPFY
ncbi:MAG: hypothetical protein KJ559_01350 [Nanoarchaeota archaeon]|nr:hypothetical protein [Nanoarchaeota archaeon]